MFPKRWAAKLKEWMRSGLAKLRRERLRPSEEIQLGQVNLDESRLTSHPNSIGEDTAPSSLDTDLPTTTARRSTAQITSSPENTEPTPNVPPVTNNVEPEVPTQLTHTTTDEDPCRQTLLHEALEGWKLKNPAIYDELINSGADEGDLITDLEKLVNKTKWRERSIKAATEDALRNILDFKDVLFAIGNFDPTKATVLALRGTFHIMQSLVNDATLLRTVGDSVTVLASTIRHWTDIEFRYSLNAPIGTIKAYKAIESPLLELYTSVLEVLGVLYVECRRGRLVGYLATFENQGRILELVERMKLKASSCQEAFDRRKSEMDQTKEIRQWLSPLDALSVHKGLCDKMNLEKYPGCSQWLFKSDKYTQWLAGRIPILWISGTVGTGKTTLMAQIIQSHLKTPSIDAKDRLAYFYCSKQEGLGRSSYIEILRSLLRQTSHDRITDKLAPNVLVAHNARHMDPGVRSDCEKLLAGILRTGLNVRIVIDALDELDEPERLLQALKKLCELEPDRIQLLLSGRKNVDVKLEFDRVVELFVDSDKTQEDMHSFVKTWVSLLPKSQKLLGGRHEHLEHELQKVLCEKANGMFRWAELQLSYFYKRKNPYKYASQVSDHLNALRENSLEGAKALEYIYKQIFEDNVSNGSLERSLAKFAYQILIATKTMVHISCMARALCWYKSTITKDNEPVTESHVFSLTQNFVVQAQTTELTFAHISASEYLQHCEDYAPAVCQAELSKACINYLDAQDPILFKHQMRKYWWWGRGEPWSMGSRTTPPPISSWAYYAFKYWGQCYATTPRGERGADSVTRLLLELANDSTDTPNFFDVLRETESIRYRRAGPAVVRPYGKDCVAAEYNLVDLLQTLYTSEEKDSYLSVPKLSRCARVAMRYKSLEAFQLVSTKWTELSSTSFECYEMRFHQSPLFFAVIHRNRKAVKFALGTGITQTSEPLVAKAVQFKDSAILKMLLRHGVNPNTIDRNYKTALQYAQENYDQDRIDLLLEHGAEASPF
ncbi:hypothetical protein FB567DRAFT_628309 [Paraphoma chrysanthemicola]|uniref:Nephrocystin 3-like N-terminal domain-containing protein n=1 Tax=Paraphoma chrysanthemicola TaxID=798071 RepID=A0A8K0R8A4_9PLEO|nr:hypothetical protein FB567DRAFT_628309 [Paraphoma chrysanthemicola]